MDYNQRIMFDANPLFRVGASAAIKTTNDFVDSARYGAASVQNVSRVLKNVANSVGSAASSASGLANVATSSVPSYVFNAQQAALANQLTQQSFVDTQRYNSAEAQKNRDFQERMSNTAYQRAVQDMRLAGINPILAYTQGGASAPSGSAASVSAPGYDAANGSSTLWDSIIPIVAMVSAVISSVSSAVKARK